MSRQDGVGYMEAGLLRQLGMAYSTLGSHSEAIDAHDEALRLARRDHDRVNEPDNLGYYGDALYAAGKHDEARAAWTAFFDMVDAMGAREGLPSWLYGSTQHAEREAVRRARLQESP